jgi:hypothetical protein
MSQWLAKLNPVRLPFELFSSDNPLLAPMAQWAEQVRGDRQPVGPENPFVQLQEKVSSAIVESLTAWGEARDKMIENLFMAAYGSPLLQAMVGLRASDEPPRRRPGEEPEHVAFVAAETERLKGLIDQGACREAGIRALIYVRSPQKASDERSFNMLRQLRHDYGAAITLAEFKTLVREQARLLQIDAGLAVAAIPTLLARQPEVAARTLDDLRRVLNAGGPLSDEGAARLAEVERLFAKVVPVKTLPVVEAETVAAEPVLPAPEMKTDKTKPVRLASTGRRKVPVRGRGV